MAEKTALPYPPPWMDIVTLCAHICMSQNGVDGWVAQGILPPPRKRGGKLVWKWAEVDEWLTLGKAAGLAGDPAERIRNATRAAANEARPRN